MAIDFPSSPTVGSAYVVGGSVYRWSGTVWLFERKADTADDYNYVVNPSMQISQQNGTTASATAASVNYYPADQWFVNGGNAVGTYFTTSRYANADLQMQCATVNAAPAVNDYIQILQPIEGYRTSDWQWGKSAAVPLVLAFDASFDGNAAGTYTVCIRNSATDRSFLVPFTLSGTALQRYRYEISIAPCFDGVWLIDQNVGAYLGFSLSAGTTFGGGVAGWQNANKLTIAGSKNFMDTAANAVYFTNIGLYKDPLSTGKAPKFVKPKFEDDLETCHRYYWKGMPQATTFNIGIYIANGIGSFHVAWPRPMRIVPTVTGDFTGSTGTLAPPIYGGVTTETGTRMYGTYSVAGNAHWNNAAANYLAASARM